MGELAELWAWGFQLGDRRHPWGTMPHELPETVLRGGAEHGLPTILRAAHAPHPQRPVTDVQLQLAAGTSTAEVRARLDADLGAGEHVDTAHGPEKSNSHWQLDGAAVLLTAYPSDWGFDHGRSSGRLIVSVQRERIAEPYLATFREGADVPPGDLHLVPAPGLRDMGDRHDALSLALTRPDLRATPAWVTARLKRDRVAVWTSGDASGISVPLFTLPLPAAFRHIRWAAARGAGYATLDAGPDRELMTTEPGPRGLDAVAAELAGRGLHVDRTEERDWG